MIECPTDQELEALLDERAIALGSPMQGSSLLAHHVESCGRCTGRIDELQRDRIFMSEVVGALSAPPDRRGEAPTPKPTPATLEIRGYEVHHELHRGAQGVVFAGRQLSTNRPVALKVLYRDTGTSLRMRQRFLREVELAAQLRHPNIVTIYDSGETDDERLYLAMELVEGDRLDAFVQRIRRDPILPPRARERGLLSLFCAICDGVAHAHDRSVIHRDLKPGNILVTPDGAPKVLDFGLAKAMTDDGRQIALNTIAGSFMGTIAYASPEQTRGIPDAIDARSDIYALGVLLYEIVTSRLPYDVTGSLADGIANVANAAPAMPINWSFSGSADRDLQTIILKALAKEPDRRYASVADLRQDVEHYLRGEPIAARRDSPTYLLAKGLKRRRSALLVGALVLGLAGATTMLLRALSATRQTAERTGELVELYAARLAQDEMWNATSGAALEPMALPDDAAAIDRDAVVIVNTAEPPQSLNPLFMRRGDLFVCELIFERLFWRTSRLDLIPNTHLVASVIETDDPRVKLVRLRESLFWHDGHPLTTDDVIFSWRLTISEPIGSTKRRQAARIASIDAVDATTLSFRFAEPHASWRLSMNFELVPRHLFEQGIEDDPAARNSEYFRRLHRNPVGSGPFRFVSWTDDEIALERFDQFGDLAPAVGGLLVRWLDTPELRLDAFLAGRLDLVDLTFQQFRDVVYTDAFKQAGIHARRPSSRYHTILWNCADPQHRFDHINVRRAMTLAIDIDRIKSEVTNNLAAACFGPWPVESPAFDTAVRRFAHRPAAARTLLDQTGWRIARDKLRYRDGAAAREPLSFELLVFDAEPGAMQTAEIVRDNLRDIGVAVAIVPESDRSELIDRLEAGDFDACLLAITPGVDAELHRPEFETGNDRNFSRYTNPEVDRLFDQAALETNENARVKQYRRIHRLIYDDQPRTFLYHEPALWAVSHRLSGVVFSNRGPYYFQPGVCDWWVPTDPARP